MQTVHDVRRFNIFEGREVKGTCLSWTEEHCCDLRISFPIVVAGRLFNTLLEANESA